MLIMVPSQSKQGGERYAHVPGRIGGRKKPRLYKHYGTAKKEAGMEEFHKGGKETVARTRLRVP